MATISYLLLAAALMELVCCGKAWYYQSGTNHGQSTNSHLLKHQFLLPPYPTYQHELLHQPPPPAYTVHDNRYYGAPGEFAEPTNFNELSFEGPYEVTSPRIPGLYFRLSSGVFVPVKAVYSFPPYLERIIQRIQGYYSVYNPPESLGLDRPLAGGALPVQPTEVHPIIPQHPGDVKPGLGYIPPPPPPPPGYIPPPAPETPKPEEPTTTEETTTTSSTTTTTESTKEETTPSGELSEIVSSTESIEATTDSPVEQTTTA